MPRIPKRLMALAGLAGAGTAGGAAFFRRRRAGRPTPPAPSPSAPPATAGGVTPPAPVAPPPVEAPGPSVTPPAEPASETERAERAEAATPDPDVLSRQAGGPVDPLVEAETNAAAAEAGAIGGPRLDDAHGDPAMEPVYEAGGGDAEGFEAAEDQLIENASHGAGGGNPLRDAFTPEIEADEATAVGGEADEEKVSEVVEGESPQDGGAGPGITHER